MEYSFYEKRARQRKTKNKKNIEKNKIMDIVATNTKEKTDIRLRYALDTSEIHLIYV